MGSFGKCRSIRHIVRLRQTLRRWKARACSTTTVPADVPEGHVAVRVGTTSRRFVIRTAYLSHPLFRSLLLKAEEEYGFEHAGPLAIPCDEALFEQILLRVSSSYHGGASPCHIGAMEGIWHDSRPLLRGFAGDSSVW